MEITHTNDPYEKEILIIKSHVKKFLKSKGIRCQDKTYRTINDLLLECLEKSIIRTKLSKRRTMAPCHV